MGRVRGGWYINLQIRKLGPQDLDAVLAIENAAFSIPFTRRMFVELLKNDSCSLIVTENGDAVAGYAVYSHVADESELITIAVGENYRRCGIGSRLMEHIIIELKKVRVEKLFLEVRPSNKAAKHFYRKFGFYQVGLRKGYYHDTGEDALVMMRKI